MNNGEIIEAIHACTAGKKKAKKKAEYAKHEPYLSSRVHHCYSVSIFLELDTPFVFVFYKGGGGGKGDMISVRMLMMI